MRDHHSGDLFDPWEHLGAKRRAMLDRSWAGVFRDHLLECLPVAEVARHFSQRMGRPSKDLPAAIGMLILQQLHDLTDAATVEALAFNMAWHYALDIRHEADAYVCEKTLRNYRRLIVEQGLEELLFRGLTDRLIGSFSVDTSRQRLDSTAIRSAMRSLTRLGVVVETISKFLRELARTHPDLHRKVDEELIRKYVQREGDGCFADTTPTESKRRLPEAGRDLLTLAEMFQKTAAESLESYQILRRVLGEQFEVVQDDQEDGGPSLQIRPPKDIPCDNVRNPADPDSSYNTHKGQGYTVQVMETYQEDDGDDAPSQPDLITHVAVHKMTVHDGHQLKPAMTDVAERDAGPQVLLADSHYGSTPNVQQAAEQGVELVSPSMPPKGAKQGKLTLEQFELDDQGRVIQCPAGDEPRSASVGPKKIQASFDPSTCRECPLLERCPVQSSVRRKRGARMQYTHPRVAQRARRLEEQAPQFRERYRWRAGSEATMSRLKHQMGLAWLRVRGMASVTYVALLRALGLNIRRCAAFVATL